MYKIDFKKMSKETHIPIETIKTIYCPAVCCHPRNISILGTKLDKAKTIEEIKKIYYNCPSGSEIEKEAIRKLAKFYKK